MVTTGAASSRASIVGDGDALMIEQSDTPASTVEPHLIKSVEQVSLTMVRCLESECLRACCRSEIEPGKRFKMGMFWLGHHHDVSTVRVFDVCVGRHVALTSQQSSRSNHRPALHHTLPYVCLSRNHHLRSALLHLYLTPLRGV